MYSVKWVYKGLMSSMSNASDPILSKAWHKPVLLKVSCIKTKYSGNFNTKKRNICFNDSDISLSLPHSSC